MIRRVTLIACCAGVLQSGRGRHLLRASKPGPTLAHGSGVVAGYPCFVRSALLEKHRGRYLLDDSLVIRWAPT
jgi:hypothetical protein